LSPRRGSGGNPARVGGPREFQPRNPNRRMVGTDHAGDDL
jgi:hypothetical protein